MTWEVIAGDCREVMAAMEPDSVESIVTDPPYELSFMGKHWDGTGVAFQCETWAAALRVLKPGGHLLAFGGTRTHHRMMVAIEDAGFELRDTIMWVYGSGFPKSLDIGKAIDKGAGAERRRIPLVGGALNSGTANGWNGSSPHSPTAPLAGTQFDNEPITDLARQWDGWGTALKPAYEIIVLARKPFPGSVAANVAKYGTGGLNIDASRIPAEPELAKNWNRTQSAKQGIASTGLGAVELNGYTPSGRWPANVILDEAAAAALDRMSGESVSVRNARRTDRADHASYGMRDQPGVEVGYDDAGGASRFFYIAKADRAERTTNGYVAPTDAAHPTVKPVALLTHLVTLVTPPGGTVLDPFAGSGTTLVAATRAGFHAIGIEQSPEYVTLARQRITGDAPLFNIAAEADQAAAGA